MTDRELLELAAKAAGLHDLTYFDEGAAGGKGMRRDELDWDNWNPLEDDGDAFRLAISCRLNITFIVRHNALEHIFVEGNDADLGSDPYTATRRAIVRAAAEIGGGV